MRPQTFTAQMDRAFARTVSVVIAAVMPVTAVLVLVQAL